VYNGAEMELSWCVLVGRHHTVKTYCHREKHAHESRGVWFGPQLRHLSQTRAFSHRRQAYCHQDIAIVTSPISLPSFARNCFVCLCEILT